MYNTYERNETLHPSQEEVEQIFREAYENGLEHTAEGKVADYSGWSLPVTPSIRS